MDALTIVSQSLPPIMATLPYSFQLQALGGVPPYAWTIVGGFGTPPAGLNLVGDTLTALAGAVSESEVGAHTFRVRVTDAALTSVNADVTMDVRPYGFTRAYDFLLDPQVFSLIQAYLSGNQTPEKVQKHFFRDISTSIGEYFLHLSRDVLVEDWLGLFPFHVAADEGLRDVLDSVANDLLFFANPLKLRVTSVVPGPGALQVTYTLPSTVGVFIGRNGETDAGTARKWFRLVDCDSEDEPEDGDGNPLVIITVSDANSVEINPNSNAYQSDTDGFHTGKDGVGTPIGYDLTIIVEYVPNPSNKIPPTPWCMRYGERAELHEVSPEAFIKFGNVLGEVDADVIALIKSAPFVGGIRVGERVVRPSSDQEIVFQGQNGLNIEADVVNSLIRLVAPDSVRTINQVPTAGAGDLEIRDGEFIEVVSEVNEGHLTIKTVIPLQTRGDIVPKGLVSEGDYGKLLQLVGARLIRMHRHSGLDVSIGEPDDGFTDGYIPLDADGTLPETLDRINEAMLVLAGGVPIVQDLDGVNLIEVANISRDRGFLAQDAGITYEGVFPSGSEAPYVYNDAANISGSLPMQSATAIEFGDVIGTAPGPADTLEIWVNGSLLESWTLATAAPIVATSPGGYMEVTSVRTVGAAGDAIRLQGNVDPSDVSVIALLVRGYNYFELKHVDTGGVVSYTSQPFKVFLDPTVPSSGGIALPVTVFGDAPGKHVILSGVDHYSGDNELLVDFTGNNTFEDTYFQKPYSVQIKDPETNNWQDPVVIDISDMTGVSAPPESLDDPVVTAFPTGRPIKDYSVEQSVLNAYLRLNHMRPGGTFVLDQATSITTVGADTVLYTLNTADTLDKAEFFEDERYRLNKDDPKWSSYQWIPVMVRQTFHWHSDLALYPGLAPWGDGGGDPGQLQVNPRVGHGPFNINPQEGALVWPLINYNAGSYQPLQTAGRDYGNDFAGTSVCIYDRAFVFKDAPRSHGKLRIAGIQAAQIGQSYLGSVGAPTGDVNLEIKFPGHKTGYFSGWLDLSKLSLGGGHFADGDGCRVGAIVDIALPGGTPAVEIDWTGNGLSTVDSGEMIILRVTYRATTPAVFSMEEVG